MKRRQQIDGDTMRAADRQFVVTVVEQTAAQQPGIDTEIVATQSSLDRDFPHACSAEQQIVVRVVEQFVRILRQALRRSRGPQQQMRVEQQLHAGWSPNSRSISLLPMRSKSSGTAICPAMKPRRLALPAVGTSRAVTLTSGLPAFAMMNGSPLAAASTRRERWVLASWMLTVRMRSLSQTKFGWSRRLSWMSC